MAGSLCLPVCFTVVVYCLESIFIYRITIVSMARKRQGGGEGAVLQLAGSRSCLLPQC